MSYRSWALGFVCLAAWGCGPPQVVVVTPPGVDPASLETPSEADAAQALGEESARIDNSRAVTEIALAEPTQPGEEKTTASGLKYETIQQGTGDQALAGDQVMVHHVGKIATNGEVFDSTRVRDKPEVFRLSDGGKIKGYDEGITGMKVGEIRRLTIPPDLAYGDEGSRPVIPPRATLIFEVELLGVQ